MVNSYGWNGPGETEHQSEIAQCQEELGSLAIQIAEAGKKLEKVRQGCFATKGVFEGPEVQALESHIESLTLRWSDLSQELSRKSQKKSGTGDSPTPRTDRADHREPKDEQRPGGAKGGTNAPKSRLSAEFSSQGSKKAKGQSKRNNAARGKSKGKKAGSVMRGVSTANRVRRVTLIG